MRRRARVYDRTHLGCHLSVWAHVAGMSVAPPPPHCVYSCIYRFHLSRAHLGRSGLSVFHMRMHAMARVYAHTPCSSANYDGVHACLRGCILIPSTCVVVEVWPLAVRERMRPDVLADCASASGIHACTFAHARTHARAHAGTIVPCYVVPSRITTYPATPCHATWYVGSLADAVA